MTQEDRERVNCIVEALLCLPPERRPGAIDVLCPDESVTSIRGEVQRLLEDDDRLALQLANLPQSAPTTTATAPPAALESPVPEHTPAVIGRYHIRSCLGSGGMGQVFLAEQFEPIRQTVALKLIKAGFDTLDVIARFDAERKVLARMDHQNIARIVDAGTTESGRPYFVMEYVPGKPLTEYADERRMDIPQRLVLFLEVCRAVAHAHTKGVIHRDIKPSNVLAWMQEDGTPRIKVIDFGIAKALGGDTTRPLETYLTQAGAVLGTYEFMSPEQASGSADIDTRSDVYSLGVLLYEILAGVRPFERSALAAQTDEELRRVIREVEPARPASRVATLEGGELQRQVAEARQTEPAELVRTLQRELEWIPLKAMRKQPERRYASTNELASDVQKYLDGRPLLAAPESRLYLLRKTVSRYRAPIAAAVIMAILLVIAAVGTSIGLVREAAARRASDWNAYRAAVGAADVAMQNHDSVRLRWALDAAPQRFRGWEWQALAYAGRPVATRLAAAAGEHFVSASTTADSSHAWGSAGGVSVLWDITTGQIQRREPGYVCADPAGRCFAAARPDGAIEVFDEKTAQRLWRVEAGSPDRLWRLSANAFSLDGKLLAAWDGSADTITIFDVSTGVPRRLPLGAPPSDIAGFIDFGDQSVTGHLVFVSEMASGSFEEDIIAGGSSRTHAFSIMLGRRGLSEQITDRLRAVAGGASALLPNRGLAAVGSAGGSVTIYDLRQSVPGAVPLELGTQIVGTAPVKSIVATPDEQYLVATLQDGSVHAMHAAAGGSAALKLYGAGTFALSPDGERLAVGGWGDVLCIDGFTGLVLWGRNLGPYTNDSIAWDPRGRWIVVATDPSGRNRNNNSEVFVLDAATGKQLAAWSSSPVEIDQNRPRAAPTWAGPICGMIFDPDGRNLLVSRADGSLATIDSRGWSLLSEAAAASPPSHSGREGVQVHGALLPSPDAKRLAQLVVNRSPDTKSLVSSLVVRDMADGNAIRFPVDLSGFAPTAVAWSPDPRLMAAGFINNAGSALVIVDAITGKHRTRIDTSDGAPILHMVFTRDGTRVVAITPTHCIIVEPYAGERVLHAAIARSAMGAYFAADQSLCLVDNQQGVTRLEVSDPEARRDVLQRIWPAGLPMPGSVAEARRWAAEASAALWSAYESDEPVEVTIGQRRDLAAPVQALAIHISKVRSANINGLNNTGISLTYNQDATAADLERAVNAFRAATKLKPHSPTLQENLGEALYRLHRYADCREPLTAANKLRTDMKLDRSVGACFRLAVAARLVNDPAAESLYRDAVAEMNRQAASETFDVRPLRLHAKELFGY